MTTSRDLLSREKIIDVIQRMPKDATIDDAIYRLQLLKAVAEGLKDVEDGLVIDHDGVFHELLDDHAKDSPGLERPRKAGSAAAKGSNRKQRPKGRPGIRAKA